MNHRRNQRENKKEYLETYENENTMVTIKKKQQLIYRVVDKTTLFSGELGQIGGRIKSG